MPMSNVIISTNRNPSYNDFQLLMENSTRKLNDIVKSNPKTYIGAKSDEVETIVYQTMSECAKGTLFDSTIQLISGHKFPDIIAGKYYGTEVKSTKANKWDSFGNSIFENTRVKDVNRIFLTFGKMGAPVEFRSKPYEECISDVVVDHSPRYHIDMQIQEEGNKTIFEDLNISYDDFRNLSDNEQVNLIANQSRAKLQDGEVLWWHPETSEQIVKQSLRLLSSFSIEDREYITAEAFCYFPELFSNSGKKYNRYILWLITDKNIATGNARDNFSAGGQIDFKMKNGIYIKVPAVIGNLYKYRRLIALTINTTPETILKERWKVDTISDQRIEQWIDLVSPLIAQTGKLDYKTVIDVMDIIFGNIK